jgi:hypothetical protein
MADLIRLNGYINLLRHNSNEFQAMGGGKNAWFPWKLAIGQNIHVGIKMYFVTLLSQRLDNE